ncbi:DNA-methyltransferase [Lysobacter soli]|uniref:DNA-methyltransferase n=1 Tax=Lysobacter soli TaxID=453783 RepID=UPI003CE800B3
MTVLQPIAETDLSPNDEASRARFEGLVDLLGKPFARGDRYAIFQGDCLDFMSELPDQTIDLSFTSPPYNIGKEYEKIVPIDQYIDWCAKWIGQLHRIATSRGAFVLNVGYVAIEDRARSIPIPYLLWNRIAFFLQQEIVWNYGAGVAARKALSPRNEKLLWYVKDASDYCFNLDDIRDPNVAYPNQKKNGKLRCNTLGKNPSDVWQIAKVTSGANRSSSERTKHPAQFPLDLCDRVIKGFSNKSDLVLDPFAGSGSSLEASALLQRFAIGFEVRKDYCALAAERVRKALSVMPLL